jgi:hypothetical protein
VTDCSFEQFLSVSHAVEIYFAWSAYSVHRGEAPITDHLRDYVPNLEKYKAVQFFVRRKMEIMIIVTILIILFLELKILRVFEV